MTTVYSNDFETEGDILDGWAPRIVTTAPSGENYLGIFQNQAPILDLYDLPDHDEVTVELELYIIENWWGNWLAYNNSNYDSIDYWKFSADDVFSFETTFSNNYTARQAYPDQYPDGDNPAGRDLVAFNTLGYASDPNRYDDTTYRLGYLLLFLIQKIP